MSNSGKGDSPRNCFSKQFKDNYEEINWHRGWYCNDCGFFISEKDFLTKPHLYVKNSDSSVRHQTCNFN
jgi:transcription initiation factor TFIIIB Brf1 subunit/transcription initiation factor TFIIB